jgi:hypothetical protein
MAAEIQGRDGWLPTPPASPEDCQALVRASQVVGLCGHPQGMVEARKVPGALYAALAGLPSLAHSSVSIKSLKWQLALRLLP